MLNHPSEKYRNRVSYSDKKKAELLKEALKPVKVSDLGELQFILNNLLASKNNGSVKVQAELKSSQEGKKVIDKVTLDSINVSLFSLLMDGLEVVKNRISMSGKVRDAIAAAEKSGDDVPRTFKIWDIDNIKFNVDNLIERRLGGKRKGLNIRWRFDSGEQYEFNPFTQKLYQIEAENDSKAAASTK